MAQRLEATFKAVKHIDRWGKTERQWIVPTKDGLGAACAKVSESILYAVVCAGWGYVAREALIHYTLNGMDDHHVYNTLVCWNAVEYARHLRDDVDFMIPVGDKVIDPGWMKEVVGTVTVSFDQGKWEFNFDYNEHEDTGGA